MVMNTDVVRSVNGRVLPAPGTWFIDPVHSQVEVVARHMMVSKVRGRFRDFAGAILIEEIPERSSVEVTIDAASIDTGDPGRDEHLRSADFLDVERFPVIRFVSIAVEPIPPLTNLDVGGWRVDGDLTIRDLTRPVSLELELGGTVVDPWGMPRAGFRAVDGDRARPVGHHLEPGVGSRWFAGEQVPEGQHRDRGRAPARGVRLGSRNATGASTHHGNPARRGGKRRAGFPLFRRRVRWAGRAGSALTRLRSR